MECFDGSFPVVRIAAEAGRAGTFFAPGLKWAWAAQMIAASE